TLDRLPDQLLVDAGRISVGGVEQGDAEIDAAMDRRDRLDVVGHAVVCAHAGAAEPDGRYPETSSQLAILHGVSFFILRWRWQLLMAFRALGKGTFDARAR